MENEQEGSAIIYFVLTVMLVVLIPATYHVINLFVKPRNNSKKNQCKCPLCFKKYMKRPIPSLKKYIIIFAIFFSWIILCWLAYKVSAVEKAREIFDPFSLLELEIGCSVAEIKESYRRLSFLHHPDRGGDSDSFVRIAKAYQTLMKPEMKENWEKYGNPDGPGVIIFGTVLPEWVTQKESRKYIVFLYLILIISIIPFFMFYSWRSKKSSGGVLEDSRRLLAYFFSKHSDMNSDRLLTCLSGSLEFEAFPKRSTDAEDMPRLLKLVSRAGQRQGENILNQPFSIKARALLYSHLQRIVLMSPNLSQDRAAFVVVCPVLVGELVNIFMSFVSMAHAGHVPNEPSLQTLESVLRLSAVIIQAIPLDDLSPFLQLPFIDQSNARKIIGRKKLNVRSLSDLASMDDEGTRTVLSFLNDGELGILSRVLMSLPMLEVSCNVYVAEDEEEANIITPNSIVTFAISLRRSALQSLHKLVKDDGLDSREGNSYLVHCPHFPESVYESWVVYVACGRHLMTQCMVVKDLVDDKLVQLKMTAPAKLGKYDYSVCVRSKCYIDLDVSTTVQIVVSKPPPELVVESEDSDY